MLCIDWISVGTVSDKLFNLAFDADNELLLYEVLSELRGVTRGTKILCELYLYKL